MIMKIYDSEGNEKSEVKLPKVFSTKYNPRLIKKAFLIFSSSKRQPYGANPLAGKRSSAHYHGSRHYRFTMMNREMARISRIHGKVGYMAWRARIVPQSVKGRRAHPPKAEKIWTKKMNKKEMTAAIRSAIAASSNKQLVEKHGHKFNVSPIIIEDSLESIKKTKDIRKFLDKILKEEMKRCEKKKIKPGKAKIRGRKYKKKIGPLFIVSKDCGLKKAAKNIPGVTIATPDELNIEMLAPGGQAGRLAILSNNALKELDKKFGG